METIPEYLLRQYPLGTYWISELNNTIERVEGHLKGQWSDGSDWFGITTSIKVWVHQPPPIDWKFHHKHHKITIGAWPEEPRGIHCLNGSGGTSLISTKEVYWGLIHHGIEVIIYGRNWLAMVTDDGDSSVGIPSIHQFVNGIMLLMNWDDLELANKMVGPFWHALSDLASYNDPHNDDRCFPKWIDEGMKLK